MRDRALGALLGVALGDAMGMPGQTLSAEEIARRYGRIDDLIAPFPGHPVSHGLGAGQVTDDTEQTFLLGRRLLLGGGRIDPRAWAEDLLAWEADVQARGLHDLLGPSTRRALSALLGGADPAEAGREGTTNGAAMRIAPVAIATPAEPLSALLDAVEDAARITHNTAEAISGAAAVAAVISAGIAGAGFGASLPLALAAAREGALRGTMAGARDIEARIAAALAMAEAGATPAALAAATGTSVATHEAVPAAFGLLRLAEGDAARATVLAANIGGDTDTIGAIAGGMGGACSGAAALPADRIDRIRAANRLDPEALVEGLLHLRRARG
jgi:ADP-ribosylglycohydrolase